MKLGPLHPDFGVEVLDFDILSATPAQVEELCAALDVHQLLLVRGQGRIPTDRHVEIGGWFGNLVPDGADGAMWSVLDNENSTGSVRLPFHADHTYTDCPIKVITLQAVALPNGPTGTAFVSSRNAWTTLSPERQELLAPMTVRNRHVTKISDWPVMTSEHPVRLVHPRHGKPILYVTEQNARRILELDAKESERILAELFAHAYAPAKIYTHQWQLNDLLIWDNLDLQHARPEVAEVTEGPRVMQRVALNEVPFAELLERARARESEWAAAEAKLLEDDLARS